MGHRSVTGLVATNGVLFNLSWAAYLIFRSWQWGAGGAPLWMSSYFADVLTLIVLLPIMEEILSFLYRRRIRIPTLQVLFTTVYLFIVMEWLAPKYYSFATADPWDGLAYAFGAGCFLLERRLKNKGAFSGNPKTPSKTPAALSMTKLKN